MKKFASFYSKTINLLWAAALVSLPVTSFALFSQATNSPVAPLSGLPVALLCLVWLLPYLLRRGQIPLEAKPLFVFVWISLIASAGAFFIEIPTFKDATIIRQMLRAGLTLLVGISFYLVAATLPDKLPSLRQALRWISLGGLVMLLWSLTQVFVLLSGAQDYPAWVVAVQKIFVWDKGFFFRLSHRLSGLTYEPSWFTYQMTVLYFPLWLSSSLTRQSLFTLKFRNLILEDALLMLALLEFLFSAPRISLVSLGTLGVITALLAHRKLVERLVLKWQTWRSQRLSPQPDPGRGTPTSNAFFRLLISGTLLLAYLGITAGIASFLYRRDERIQRLLSIKTNWQEAARLAILDESAWLRVSLNLYFFERVNYWFFGLHVFQRYPWLGVGLGNAGFFYLEELPAPGWESYETRGLTYSLASLPNVKNLWVRLLAESGLAGFAAFGFWLFVLWRSARLLQRANDPFYRQIALFGSLSLAALLAEGFSIDSYAFPYFWIVAGLLSAAAPLYRRGISELSA